MLRENHLNIESKSLELPIHLYRCYEHEAPSSFNTAVYLSVTMLDLKWNQKRSRSLLFGSITLSNLLVTGNDLILGCMSSCIVRISLHQQLINLGIYETITLINELTIVIIDNYIVL